MAGHIGSSRPANDARKQQLPIMLERKHRLAILAVILAAAASIGALLYFGVTAADRFQATEVAWQEYNDRTAQVSARLNALERDLGYGGFIHSYKNYVLRRDPAYLDGLENKANAGLANIDELLILLPGADEHKLLRVVAATIDEYLEKIETARTAYPTATPFEMDRLVRVDDGPALAALARLQQIVDERRVERDAQAQVAFEGALDTLRLGGFFVLIVLAGAGIMIFLVIRSSGTNRRLQAALTYVDQLYDKSPNALISVSTAGRIDRANHQAETLLGYAQDELLGEPVEMLVPARLREKHRGIRERFMKAPTYRPMMGEDIELLACRKDGSEIRIDIAISHFETASGTSFLLAIWDITELVQLHADLREARRSAEAASEAKSRFLTSMSHEIRTPLNGIIGLLQLIDGKQVGKEVARKLAIAKESGLFLLTLINQVLDFARIEAGEIAVARERFSLPAMVNAMESMFSIRAGMKGLDFHCQVIGDADRFLYGDYDHIRQILFNLIGNAVKFTDKGSIDLTARCQPLADGRRCRITFEVADTGAGIAPEDQERIFDEFVQTELGVREGGGTGLGLNISKRIADAIGATLSLESIVGEGTRFRLSLMVEIAENQEMVVGDAGISNAPPMRILVAEDNKINQMIVRAMLERDGHSVTMANNGREAVDYVRAEPQGFDLILMDVQMPDVDGVQATVSIRQFVQDGVSLPIVGLTANAFQEQKAEYLSAGMQGVLTKPIDLAQLRAALTRFSRDDGLASREAGREPGTGTGNGAVSGTDRRIEAGLNSDILNQLKSSMERSDLRRLFDGAIERSGEMVEDLRSGDLPAEKRARIAHELAGMLGNFGLHQASVSAQQIEQAVRENREFGTDIDQLERQLSDSWRAVDQELGSDPVDAP